MSTNKHLRNAETQIALELKNRVERFIRSKNNRALLVKDVSKWANELAQASELLHSQEARLPSPIPPLANAEQRSKSIAATLPERPLNS